MGLTHGMGGQARVTPLGAPGTPLPAATHGLGLQAAAPVSGQGDGHSVVLRLLALLTWCFALRLWRRCRDLECLADAASGVVDGVPVLPVGWLGQAIAERASPATAALPAPLASAGIAIARTATARTPMIRSLRYTAPASIARPKGSVAQAASRSLCASMSNGPSAARGAVAARTTRGPLASRASALRASATRTSASDHANATAIGAISRPAISPAVVWLLLVAQSHAPQSSAARTAVTASGPSGIARSLAPRPDDPSYGGDSAAPGAPQAAVACPGAGAGPLRTILCQRLAGEVLWLHRSLPSF